VTVTVAGEPCAPLAVTVTCPVYVPGTSEPSAAETCNVCGAVPLVGETVSHEESLLAVNERVPPPVFVTLTEEAEGELPPSVALKLRVVGETDRTGDGVGWATTNVTVIVAGLFWAPEAVTVMWPVYVPAVRLPRVAETCTAWGAVLPEEVAESQDESLLVVKVSVPDPLFVTFTVAGAGLVPLPCVALKLTAAGDTCRIGPLELELP
jgi:hypothetical protein